jgi:hypothetical protein
VKIPEVCLVRIFQVFFCFCISKTFTLVVFLSCLVTICTN